MVATSLSGAVVNFTATPSDNVLVTSSSCTPASGSVFLLGTTGVDCTASDAAGNSGNASFNVTVEVDAGSIGTLEEEIEAMDLPNGVENSITGPLHQALRLLGDKSPNNDGAVCNKLDAFLSHVQIKLADGDITQAQADLMSALAEAIKDELNCP